MNLDRIENQQPFEEKAWSELLKISRGASVGAKEDFMAFALANRNLFEKPPESVRAGWTLEESLRYLPCVFEQKNEAVGVLHIQGSFGFHFSTHDFNEVLNEAKVAGVKSLIICVNSPGGTSTSVGSMVAALQIAKKENGIKLIGQVSEMACSGGYYLLTECQQIYTSPTAMIGSIGSIFYHEEYSAMREKMGIVDNVFKSGKYKDMCSSDRPMEEDEKKILQSRIDKDAEKFINAVAKSRNLRREAVKGFEARVYMTEEALELGLVDKIQTLDETVKEIIAIESNQYSQKQYSSQSVSLNSSSKPNKKMDEQFLNELKSLTSQVAKLEIEKNELKNKCEQFEIQLKDLSAENDKARDHLTLMTINSIQKATGKIVDEVKVTELKSKSVSNLMTELDLWNGVSAKHSQGVINLSHDPGGKEKEEGDIAIAQIVKSFASSPMAKPGTNIKDLVAAIAGK